MNWQELHKEAHNLSVSDRLLLVKAIVGSLSEEFRPRPPVPKGTLTGLHGLLKTDGPPPTDGEIEAMLEERLEEKYL